MKYTLENGKVVNINEKELEKLMKGLDVSKEEAIDIWLEDNEYQVNEEQEELDKKASKVKIQHGASADTPKEKKKVVTHKTSDEKKELFNTILTNLTRCIGVENENIKVLTENKLIEVTLNGKVFKVDLIETRPKKA